MRFEELNALTLSEFVQALAGVWENSSWIACEVWEHRPFSSRGELFDAMTEIVARAGEDAQMALIRAHPELAGERALTLTVESTSEQSVAGLRDLRTEQLLEFQSLNAWYREAFGFPFVLCVRGHTPESILAAFHDRLARTPECERENAISEIMKIASLRLSDLIEDNE